MIVDLRSDTLTLPTLEMKEAMFNAEVGDDVYGEDPTVLALETKTAQLFGKEAALFCVSGTMSNQIGIKALTNPPGQVICHELSHIYLYEVGGIAFNSGLSVSLVSGNGGLLTAKDVESRINPDDVHKPPTQLVGLENTCNRGGGCCYELADIAAIRKVCDRHNLSLHLDGARVFNALVAKGYTAAQLGQYFDSISICLSKGLGTPVGSVLLGNAVMIRRARQIRKLFGGGMRQAGYLAAAGIYALDHHIERMAEDHKRARLIGDTLTALAYVKEVLPVETNIVVCRLEDKLDLQAFLAKLAAKGIKAARFGPQAFRMVTHLDIDDAKLEKTLSVLKAMD